MVRSYWKMLVWVLVVLVVIWYLLNVQYGSLPAFHIPLSIVFVGCWLMAASHGKL